jgi:glycosyltransferase involved in cell wall biosynthesis
VKALSKIDNPSVIIGSKINTVETRHVLSEVKKNKNIILIDELPNSSELLASAYAACKVFVLPSLFETPGIAALEAALSRANIVITPFGGTKDYFNDLVQYVNPFSVEDIRKGIETSLNKDKSNVLSDFVKANFLWDKIAERTIQVYNNIKKV